AGGMTLWQASNGNHRASNDPQRGTSGGHLFRNLRGIEAGAATLAHIQENGCPRLDPGQHPVFRSRRCKNSRAVSGPSESETALVLGALEHFQEKWRPVFRPKMRP